MIITDNLKKINKNEKKLLILGEFDGVHKGHVSLIEKSVEIAKAENLSCCVYTFKVNTKLLTRGNVSFLTTDEEKNGIFEKYGLDCVYYEDFESVKNMEPREFCKYLAEYFGAKRIVCGENFSFGKNASAGTTYLSTSARTFFTALSRSATESVPFLIASNIHLRQIAESPGISRSQPAKILATRSRIAPQSVITSP